MKIAEGVYKATVKKVGELSPLLICKSGIVPVGARILQVDLGVRDIHVTANYDSLPSGIQTKKV